MDPCSDETFLCACQLLADRAPDMTFSELLVFAERVYAEPVLPLVPQARRVCSAFEKACESDAGVALARLVGRSLAPTGSIADASRFYDEFIETRRPSRGRASVPMVGPLGNGASPSEWHDLCREVMDRTVAIALSTIESDSVADYVERSDAEPYRVALGAVFEVLGRHAETLAVRSEFCRLVASLAGQFQY
jgi:hypothetical protein